MTQIDLSRVFLPNHHHLHYLHLVKELHKNQFTHSLSDLDYVNFHDEYYRILHDRRPVVRPQSNKSMDGIKGSDVIQTTPNHYIRMISEGPGDTVDCSNDC